MIIIDEKKVYIDIENKYSVNINTHVYVEDIGQVYCRDSVIKKKVEKIRIYNGQSKEMYDYITTNEIVTKILEVAGDLDITIIGGPDVLLEIKEQEEANWLFNFIKIAFVMLILFLGSGAAIINFYEDVNMAKSIEKIYFTITGIRKENPLILSISMSLGTGLGMFAFFSRIFSFSKRRRQEPGPMELELYLYDKDLEDNILNDLKKHKEQ